MAPFLNLSYFPMNYFQNWLTFIRMAPHMMLNISYNMNNNIDANSAA